MAVSLSSARPISKGASLLHRVVFAYGATTLGAPRRLVGYLLATVGNHALCLAELMVGHRLHRQTASTASQIGCVPTEASPGRVTGRLCQDEPILVGSELHMSNVEYGWRW
jgi:hypothetical protein